MMTNYQEYDNQKALDSLRTLMISVCFLTVFLFLSILCGVAKADEVNTARAVIHHTASEDVSAETINKWHKMRGWDGIGYHFVIRRDGSREMGRSHSKLGAHAKGRNHMLGIVLTGYDDFTPEQIHSLKELLLKMGVSHIEPHHKDCPGHGLDLEQLAHETNVTYTMWSEVRYVSAKGGK